jgi:uncharacterized protein (DUF983 family)
LARRCPLCGSGDCFQSFLAVRERCPRCNFPLHREEGHWLGAVAMNTVVTCGLMLITLVVAFALTWSDRRAAAVLVPLFTVAVVTPIAFFGPSQTLWSAIDLLMKPVEPADDIDPRWLPPAKRRAWS